MYYGMSLQAFNERTKKFVQSTTARLDFILLTCKHFVYLLISLIYLVICYAYLFTRTSFAAYWQTETVADYLLLLKDPAVVAGLFVSVTHAWPL